MLLLKISGEKLSQSFIKMLSTPVPPEDPANHTRITMRPNESRLLAFQKYWVYFYSNQASLHVRWHYATNPTTLNLCPSNI